MAADVRDDLFGHVAMIQALLPLLIQSSGTIVNVSSVGGKVGMASYGPYAGSKFALEAVSDALRREVAPLGVRVVVVQPGAVATNMLSAVSETGDRIMRDMTIAQRERYSALMQSVIAQAKRALSRGVPASKVGHVIATAITTGNSRTRYALGRDVAMIVCLVRLLPDRWLDSILARI